MDGGSAVPGETGDARAGDDRDGAVLRQSEDSRYVALCLPHILMRLPYGKDNVQVDGFGVK